MKTENCFEDVGSYLLFLLEIYNQEVSFIFRGGGGVESKIFPYD